MTWKSSAAFSLALAAALAACQPKTKLTDNNQKPKKTPKEEVVNMEVAEVEASRPNTFVRPNYNPSYPRRNDLLHTKLDVRFDWSKQHLLGKAHLTLKPLFYPTDSLRLDAKGFEIQKVALIKNGQEQPLQYRYDDKRNIYIKLDRTYKNTEEYTVFIQYIAKPNELPKGGSQAITQDKGLYFINPLGTEDKPQQIWTQGETEASSCWFPTVDRPNERCTQEISITVENRFKTLSNGLLKSSTPNSDGTRTDYWVMDKPHAPYLFMMAVGEFAVVKDDWNGMLLEYYVEPKFEKDAKAIFPHTPEMLTFFSNILGVKYPWQKYSQVIVRDYVSGAMENTTAVIFGDFVQKDKRSLIDGFEVNEGIVAHEMMHHWFGDLVTCESWSNLPLNESFANYSEYLWVEYKHGKDAADYHEMGEIAGYMNQAVVRGSRHPLIHFGYKDKEDMFDSHSYNKGGAILHMLRKYIGDDAFFKSLKYYLETHQYQAAEAHDLRLAFEKVTGEDLNWFFNQWFFTAGHPRLEIQREYDAAKKQVVLTLEQTQSLENSTVFILPLAIDVHLPGGKVVRHNIRMTDQKQVFSFPAEAQPRWVAVDAERITLCERKEKQTAEEWMAQYELSKQVADRIEALKELRYRQADNANIKKTFEKALGDSFWAVRSNAVAWIKLDKNDKAIADRIVQLGKTDPRPSVRSEAIIRLNGLEEQGLATLEPAKHAIQFDSSFNVISTAISVIANKDPKEALQYAKMLEKEENEGILAAIAGIYSKTQDRGYISFYETKWLKTSNYATLNFVDAYVEYLLAQKDEKLLVEKGEWFYKNALNPGLSLWHRYAATLSVKKLRDHFFGEEKKDKANIMDGYIKTIKSKETDNNLIRLYESF